MSRTRVLILINGLGTGGAERSLRETLPLLPELGVEPVVACLFRRDEGVEAMVLSSGQRVEFVAGRSWRGRWRSLRNLLESVQPDLVHTTLFEADVLGRLAARPRRVPVLTSLVNTSYGERRCDDPRVTAWKLELVRQVDGLTARLLTTHFHAITGAVKSAAVRSLGIDPSLITVVERGRDQRRLGEPGSARRSGVRERLGLEAEAELVLTVGRQEYQKAHPDLVRAFNHLARSRHRAHLVIAGRRGAASTELDETIGRSVHADRIHVLGHRDDVPDLLAGADVFAFPSRYEGLGGAVIEAMALGLPIVATRIPALVEVLDEGDNADLVPVDDPRSLADALENLLSDPARRRRYGAHSRIVFERCFTLERSASRMAHLYRRVAAADAQR